MSKWAQWIWFRLKDMQILGIRFAPLYVPFRRRMQTLAAASWFITMALGGIIGLLVAIYVVLFTKYWWIMSLYVLWACVLDKDTPEKGGRRVTWVRNWIWWKYFRDYFPIELKKLPGVELDPQKNYLFCAFPHGILPAGAFNAFCTDVGGVTELFPSHTSYQFALAQQFYMPFFRDLALSLGGCSSSAASIRHIIGTGSGKIGSLVVGGAQESFFCRPGQYKFILHKRKGFVKLALQTGAPLVPVISFGETDLFDQLGKEDDSMLRRIQEKLRKVIGLAPVIPVGRGLFQYTVGLVPRRKPVTTVVGMPVEVDKIENPTKEDIDKWHARFCEQLIKLFEGEKHKYVRNPEETKLVIE